MATTEDRPHISSERCWCGPTRLSYGAEPVYDEDGTLLRIDAPPEDEDE